MLLLWHNVLSNEHRRHIPSSKHSIVGNEIAVSARWPLRLLWGHLRHRPIPSQRELTGILRCLFKLLVLRFVAPNIFAFKSVLPRVAPAVMRHCIRNETNIERVPPRIGVNSKKNAIGQCPAQTVCGFVWGYQVPTNAEINEINDTNWWPCK